MLILSLLSKTAQCRMVISGAKPYCNIGRESAVRFNKLSKMRAGMQEFVKGVTSNCVSVGVGAEESWKEGRGM